MRERRATGRNEINQLALLHVNGIRGCHPCRVLNFHSDGAKLHSSTHHTAAIKFVCRWMDLKRRSIAVWYGGTEILVASNLLIEPLLAQRAAHSELLLAARVL